ncbi:cryptochrome/photolyase family protein [Sungkyunkwania multivorans]|uniref:Cryptochrome/photolyase family protein n=1 Tax=Sungkyunkwania multivorans TaxID=1173618 RepID=A0ABW3CX71_9FLAO
MSEALTVFWFRRDLRIADNRGFYKALTDGRQVLPIFIFDSDILEELPRDDARVNFIHDELSKMQSSFKEKGSGIAIYHGKPIEVFQKLLEAFRIEKVITNRDYEPYALERDHQISTLLAQHEVAFETFKDQVIFEKDEIVKDDGKPYVVYTPYSRKWLSAFEKEDLEFYPSEKHLNNLLQQSELPFLSLTDIGFTASSIKVPACEVTPTLIQEYEATRNFPAKDQTSRLGPHLRFGTVSIRKMVDKARKEENITFLKELIWREFFMQILWHFPQTKDQSFKTKYDRIEWRNDEDEFKRWCEGNTGFPLVDAGMRQLNQTGFMHNRVRMLVGSFLCKHLLIDWRWGEAYFAEKLLDYEMASNVGNWQWVAGSGVDAAPYFRIFNPTSQIQKFDKQLEYINQWVPDFQELTYPQPMVDHKMARERCLEVYKKAVNQ